MTSRRLDFFEMPTSVIAAVTSTLDGAVVSCRSAAAGFSPGPAGECVLDDGRSVFLKACSDELNAVATGMHRREAEVLPSLPADHPSPGLLATVDVDGWFVLVAEHVPGRTPTAPITDDEVAGVLDLVTKLADAGTPTPVDGLARIGADPAELADRNAWHAMLDVGPPATLDQWSLRNLRSLASLEVDWIEAAAGDSLLHRDLRPDNMVLNEGGGVAVDWPAASLGAPWVDLVGLLPSLEMLGGPRPSEVFDAHPVGQAADTAAVDAFLALLTGYFVGQSHKPSIPSVPGIRTFQARQGAVCRRWISERLGWDPPDDSPIIEPID